MQEWQGGQEEGRDNDISDGEVKDAGAEVS